MILKGDERYGKCAPQSVLNKFYGIRTDVDQVSGNLQLHHSQVRAFLSFPPFYLSDPSVATMLTLRSIVGGG